MVKINLKLITLIFIISNVYLYANSFAMIDKPGAIYGKVVYSDDQSPVSSGMIKVFKTNNPGNTGKVLEIADIQSNGVFKLSNQGVQTADGIKIMAYANDVDNLGPAFETTVVEAEKVLNKSAEYIMVIEVERVKTKKAKNENDSEADGNIFLKQNYPNPFNPTTLIRFELPQSSKVTLKVYNMNGMAVATLVDNQSLASGLNEFEFNASSLPSGIYVYTLSADDYSETRKMMLLK